jgi:DNA-binding LacI/PurR family transcriptional regulator
LNINDVAREAKVSKTTVSRVLLGSDKVKTETREKVLEVIRKLNYTPNTSAQMLAKKSNKVIGVINTLPISDPFFAYMNDRIAYECEKYGYGTLYVVCGSKSLEGCDREIGLLYGKVDAYILTGNNRQGVRQENVAKLVSIGMPVALFKTGITQDGAITVDIDNRKSGELGADFLYQKGYRRIGYLHGDGAENGIRDFKEGQERYLGFQQKLQTYGLPLEREFYGNRSYKTAGSLADKILDAGIDALFCDTDMMAYGIISAFMEKGVKVPDRIAVLGFDDVKFTNYEPLIRLSTVAQPIDRMAACIVGALVNRIENQVPYGKVQLFDAKIVEGRTT